MGPDVTLTVVSAAHRPGESETEGAATTCPHVAPRQSGPDAPLPDVVPGEPARLVTPHVQIEISTRPLRLALARRARAVGAPGAPPDGGMAETVDAERPAPEFAPASPSPGELSTSTASGRAAASSTASARTRQLWNSHLGHGPGSDIGIPLLISSRGYALFFDNPSDATLAVGRSDNGVRIDYTAEAAALTWYFLIGPDLRGLMGEVAGAARAGAAAAAVGARLSAVDPPLRRHRRAAARCPARFARGGFHATRSSISRATARPRAGTAAWGISSSSPSSGPDRPRCSSDVRAQHFEVITHEYPVLHEESPLFAEAEASGYLLATGYERGDRRRAPTTVRASAISTSRIRRCARGGGRRTASWWGSASAGWWLDGGEGPPASAKLAGGDGTRLHNIYDRLRHEAFAEGEAAARPEQRRFCSAARGPPACSGSAPRPGRATSTTTSRRWMRRSRWD